MGWNCGRTKAMTCGLLTMRPCRSREIPEAGQLDALLVEPGPDRRVTQHLHLGSALGPVARVGVLCETRMAAQLAPAGREGRQEPAQGPGGEQLGPRPAALVLAVEAP